MFALALPLAFTFLVPSTSTNDASHKDSARADHLEVTPQGAFVRTGRGLAVPSTGAAKSTAAGALWSYGDNGLAWIATAVSIGDRGGQVFTEFDQNSERAELFSVYDTSPPTPVWTDTTPFGTEFRQVASADAQPIHVAIDQVVLGGQMTTRQAILRKYTSSSGTPDWTYTFAPVINAQSNVAISRDGQRIVAAIFDDTNWEVEIAVFAPGSNVPLSYTAVPTGTNGYLRGFDLSSDGSTLYFTGGTTAYLFDVASAQVVHTSPLNALFDSHAISGDGKVFANGSFNAMYVWEKQGATWVNTFTRSVAGQCYCAEIDISDDGSTIASGWTFYSNYLTVRVEALDVATKATTMSNVASGLGSKQNVIADVSISADGKHFAVGVWGDAGGIVPELRIFDRAQNAPIATIDTPGSVFDVEISADGKRAIAGSKAVHANDFGNGGRLDLLDAGGSDLALRGAPRIGATVQFDLHFTPGKNAFLMQSLGEDPTPATFPGIGTLHIDRATLTFLPAGTVPAGGVATKSLSIANNPALVGTSLYFQGFSVPPRQFSSDWIKMTILP
ncbi:MAG: hypothetical protein IT453_06445 [Planctomycetes bacterium]|nr:hypothetical protein [Planctomycetota bacterium]